VDFFSSIGRALNFGTGELKRVSHTFFGGADVFALSLPRFAPPLFAASVGPLLRLLSPAKPVGKYRDLVSSFVAFTFFPSLFSGFNLWRRGMDVPPASPLFPGRFSLLSLLSVTPTVSSPLPDCDRSPPTFSSPQWAS